MAAQQGRMEPRQGEDNEAQGGQPTLGPGKGQARQPRLAHGDVATQGLGKARERAATTPQRSRGRAVAAGSRVERPEAQPLAGVRVVLAGRGHGAAMAGFRAAESAAACQRVTPWLVQAWVVRARAGTWFPGPRRGHAG